MGGSPLRSFDDTTEAIARAKLGSALSMRDLLQVGRGLGAARAARQSLVKPEEEGEPGLLTAMASNLTAMRELQEDIERCILSEEEMAVVTTFGKPAVEEASGLHFKIPVIQRVTKVSKAITGMQIGYTTDPARADGASIDNPVSIENESLMITKDFNLTNVDFYVEYMVTDPVQAVRHRSVYESIIKNLAQSYIRDTVGVYNVDDVITTGKTQIQERIKEQLTNRLVEENIGYGIYNVSIQDTEMPRDDVANAFKAVEDAKQGMETAINSAKKYQSENIPEAKAKADKLLQDAEAYKEQRINEANGQVARFEDTYAEYVKYPLITKKRMFYETMEEVLPDLKVIITGGNGTQTLLPLEPFSEAVSGSAAQTGGGN